MKNPTTPTAESIRDALLASYYQHSISNDPDFLNMNQMIVAGYIAEDIKKFLSIDRIDQKFHFSSLPTQIPAFTMRFNLKQYVCHANPNINNDVLENFVFKTLGSQLQDHKLPASIYAIYRETKDLGIFGRCLDYILSFFGQDVASKKLTELANVIHADYSDMLSKGANSVGSSPSL